jgi:uncharacterized delta-60 repeat protein
MARLFVLARYHPNGTLDSTFSGDGKVITTFYQERAHLTSLAVDSAGRIVTAGSAGPADVGWSNFAVARHNGVDGELDFGFYGAGRVIEGFALPYFLTNGNAVAIDADDRIVVAGRASDGGPNDRFALIRFKPTGQVDLPFKVTTDFGGTSGAHSVAIDAAGRIVAAGYAVVNFRHRFAVARYTSAGALDTTFSGDGKVTTDFAANEDARGKALAIDTSGRIVAVGWATIGGTDQIAVARYTSTGALDTVFSGDGKVTQNFAGNEGAWGKALAIDTSGRVVAAGSAKVGGKRQFALTRYTWTGAPDTTFSGDSKVTTDFVDSEWSEIHAVAIDAGGRIVAAGHVMTAAGPKFALARYHSNGTLDPNFSGDGRVVTDISGEAEAVTIDADGKILVGGYVDEP